MISIFLAPGFEEIEALAVADVLRRAELEVRLVGVGGPWITGAHGIKVECDLADEQADPQDKTLEMIVLPGGMPGALNLEKSAVVQAFIDLALQNGLWIGAICAAPSILGHRDILQGKTATCFPGFEQELRGARCTGGFVEQDGRIITAKGPGVAMDFALRLVEVLAGRERAQKVRDSLQCRPQ